VFSTATARFRTVAIAEAFSWGLLLIGMFFKYVVVHTQVLVQIFGWIHGIVFVSFVVITLLTHKTQRWAPKTTLIALASSIPPFCSVIFERWATRTGRLRENEFARAA
jgi:integral membrane protein